jgi:putative YphP/YqiW family bacilliredoxin
MRRAQVECTYEEVLMPYDPRLVQPMREELTRIGVTELTNAEDVDRFLSKSDGTALIVVNSVCGCAAGMARPGLSLALEHGNRPDRVGTVFAGQDLEATAKARGYFADFPPSSPSFALFKNGEVVHFIPRHWIEGRDAQSVAADLTAAFDKFCASGVR